MTYLLGSFIVSSDIGDHETRAHYDNRGYGFSQTNAYSCDTDWWLTKQAGDNWQTSTLVASLD